MKARIIILPWELPVQVLQLWELQQQVQPREREQPVQRVLQLQEQQAEQVSCLSERP